MVFSHSDEEPHLGGPEQGCLTNCSKLKSDHITLLNPSNGVQSFFSIKSNLLSMNHEASFYLNPALLPTPTSHSSHPSISLTLLLPASCLPLPLPLPTTLYDFPCNVHSGITLATICPSQNSPE
uniref:Uncharacterized protein n=1 Tax=Pipistrellus kuhlii TaxID=59472 RepID=A0A7J7ZJF9_PIPKU|nr:hypothetical protein mPipKuh1_009611 [Pipistrellus kuhlii]